MRPGSGRSAGRVGAEAIVVDCGNELGETPIWDEAAGLLHWVDIFAGAVWSLDPATGEASHFEHGTVVGSVVPRERGGLVLAAGRALVATDLDGNGAETLAEVEPDRPENRFNDCRVDPAGRFFGGTKVNDPDIEGRGALHRIGPDLSPAVAIADTGIANGIGWSPDGAALYFIDSPLQRIDAYEFDPATGDLGARRTVATIDPDDGLPDGLTVDAEGGIWVALVRTGTLRRYAPSGTLEAELRTEVRNPTCPGFGGESLKTLYLTSAHLRSDPTYADDHPQAGALFALDVGVPGLPIPAFAG
jgi:sugar lactone lactonase YvrE